MDRLKEIKKWWRSMLRETKDWSEVYDNIEWLIQELETTRKERDDIKQTAQGIAETVYMKQIKKLEAENSELKEKIEELKQYRDWAQIALFEQDKISKKLLVENNELKERKYD